MQKNITASDVAKSLGMSQSTVSRVFTPGASVSEETRKKVLQAANELGYRPNALARSLITRKSNIIGIVMGDIRNPFYPDVLSKFSKELSKKGYHVLFVNAENEKLSSDEVNQFLEYNVEGAVVTDASLPSSVASYLKENQIPIVMFNRYNQDSLFHAVSCDNVDGGYQIGRYLIEKGHRKFAFISGTQNTSTSKDREKGFRKALVESGYNLITDDGDYTYEGANAAALRLLASNHPPDAIFCANDIMALGVIDAAKKLGVRIPEDVSIVGFDDISLAEWTAYSLTTWKQPVNEMIEATINLLLNDIDQKESNSKPQNKSIQGKLVERSTVCDRTK
ncbi:LacI family DNA-binding transcriptional regulator [Gottfriedia acidiceleris]|uniref:LacI family DNA-binding transcriptional regulator n=1 Tax=Bacillaceae TaxID=186817 RepID=UPI002570756C|nr:LacI family DNA-binding transcriptional regulator [Bacillus sp. AFS096315]